MAAPTSISYLPTLDESFSRWPSSSSSFSSSTSRSTSFTTCPTLSKTLTDSTSDTQTENETPPESPTEICLHATPVVCDAVGRKYTGRPPLRPRVSIYSEPGNNPDVDAGYETECEDKRNHQRILFKKRRVPVERRRGARPPAITLPPPAPPTFPNAPRRPIGLGLGIDFGSLGLGFPSTLSPVRSAPNCVHRSSTDAVPRLDLFTPLSTPPPKPTLAPSSPPLPVDTMSPLFLNMPSPSPTLAHAPGQPRHPALSFSGAQSTTAAAFVTLANHAQFRDITPRQGLAPTPEEPEGDLTEVCRGDGTRGIRRFESVNPYFSALGYCVSSG